jgi:hypothetical protein
MVGGDLNFAFLHAGRALPTDSTHSNTSDRMERRGIIIKQRLIAKRWRDDQNSLVKGLRVPRLVCTM